MQVPKQSMRSKRKNAWYCLSLILVVLTACHERGNVEQVHHADAQSAEASAIAHLEDHSSPNGYQIEVSGYGENGLETKVVDVVPSYRLAAFGGELMGDDRGEFGGELMFRDKHGLVHQVLKENVHGIFQMPFGIVVFTGLAHLSFDSGRTYLVTASPGGVPIATPFHPLPGSPEQVVRALSGSLIFKVNNGRFEKNSVGYKAPAKDCYRLTKSGDVENLACASIGIVN